GGDGWARASDCGTRRNCRTSGTRTELFGGDLVFPDQFEEGAAILLCRLRRVRDVAVVRDQQAFDVVAFEFVHAARPGRAEGVICYYASGTQLEVLDVEHPSLGQKHRALDRVRELTHISRPRVAV